MIDFIKIIIKDLKPSLLEANPLLDFYDNINLKTGEIRTTNRNGNKVTPSKKAMYKNLEFKIYDTGLITLSGSLHLYWNDGKHNYNNFNNEAVLWVLSDLRTKFNIEPQQCILRCLEIGININPPIPTNEILDNCFLHKTSPFEFKYNSDEGKFKQVQHNEYIIKIYNKALNYKSKGFDIDTEIMRFELKYTTLTRLKQKGIFTLQDLINYDLYNFKHEVLKEWQNVLYYDNTIQIEALSTKLKKAVLDYRNPNYWTGLLANNQNKNFTYHKNQLKEIVLKNSNKIKDLTSKIISKRIDFLNVNTIQNEAYNISSNWIVEGLNYDVKNTYEIEVKDDSFNRTVCRVTGLSLAGQKNSHFISHTGLKLLYKSDIDLFNWVLQKHLPKQYKNSDLETKIIQIAKSIRTKDCVNHIKQNRLYQNNQPQLFG